MLNGVEIGRMTKLEILKSYYDFITSEEVTSLHARLDKLVAEKRITAGAAYYIHSPYAWYGGKRLDEITGKAAKAKNYTQYISDNVPKFEFVYSYNQVITDYRAALEFVTTNETCAFEDSQYQVLDAQGKLRK